MLGGSATPQHRGAGGHLIAPEATIKRDLLTIAALSADEILALLDEAARLKAERRAGVRRTTLAGKALALLFLKPSLRTRLSFELAMIELGGVSRFIAPTEVGLGTRESVPDVAR